ncbi:Cytosolic endo-beta-N-acetylglucosaminidase [Anthophora plagiata]
MTESKPFKTLKEFYENVDNLKPWPSIKNLRETTNYVYRGSDVNAQKIYLEKLTRQDQPKTLFCHDLQGGYLEDSHYFITVPPFGWINAAHDHGVKVLGTVITEKEGIWDSILKSQEEVRTFANALIHVAKFYKFDGWFINIENIIKSDQINNLIYFLKYLRERIHEEIRDSEIIWYDSITNEGTLSWQNELNNKNLEFFLNCDGIYLNYNWTKSKLENSNALARNYNRSVHDIYVGLDVWGRGCPGGGGFNSTYALERIRQEGLSVAIFAPSWTHEFFGSKKFQELEDLFWAQLFPYLYVHVPVYKGEMFKTSFCRGNGTLYYRCGEIQLDMHVVQGRSIFEERPFYNLSMQKPQISVPIPHLKFIHIPQPAASENVNSRDECTKNSLEYIYETKKNVIRILKNTVNIQEKTPIQDVNYFEFYNQASFEGGGCLKMFTNDLKYYHRLFLVQIEFQQDIEATIVYEEMERSTNETSSEPILILGNDIGLKCILHYKSENLNSRWKKCVYLTNIRTVNEIGVSFAKKSVCYLGEIILEQKRRHLNGGLRHDKSVSVEKVVLNRS